MARRLSGVTATETSAAAPSTAISPLKVAQPVNLEQVVKDASGEVVEEYFPDDQDGNLHKIEDWFEFDDNANKEFNFDASLQNFVTAGGEKKVARYRWNWRKRATDEPNNYTNFFALVDAVNALPNWITIMLAGLALLAIGVGILVSRERWGRWQAQVEAWWGEEAPA